MLLSKLVQVSPKLSSAVPCFKNNTTFLKMSYNSFHLNLGTGKKEVHLNYLVQSELDMILFWLTHTQAVKSGGTNTISFGHLYFSDS